MHLPEKINTSNANKTNIIINMDRHSAGPRSVGPRRSTVDTMTTSGTTSNDDIVSWDELNDTINLARRASIASATSPYPSAASVGSSGDRSGSAGGSASGIGRTANRYPSSLPTIYASGTSTRDFVGMDDSGRSGRSGHSNNSGHFDQASPGVAAAAGGHHSLSSASPDEEHYHHRPRRTLNDDQYNERLGSRGRIGPTKLNHSMRTSEHTSGLRNSNTSWDDLGDEIAMALKQSMMEDEAKNNKNASNTSTNNERQHSDPITDKEKESDGGGASNDNGAWNCPACTFLNENPLHLVCAICGTAKVASKLPSPSAKLNGSFTGSMSGSFTQGGAGHPFRQTQEDLHNSFSSLRGAARRSRNNLEEEQFHSSFSSLRDSRRGGGGRRQRGYDEDLHSSSFTSHRRSTNGYDDDNNNLRQSASSRGSMGGPPGVASGRGGRRRGVRRGATTNAQSSQQDPRLDRRSRETSELNSSFRNSAGEQSLDSFGSFNSKNQQLHSFNKSNSRGGRSSMEDQRKSLRRSASGGGASSVSSYHSSRRHNRSSSAMAQSTKVGGGRSVGGRDKNYRRSTSMVDYHHHDDGYGGGHHHHRSNDRYDDEDYTSDDERIGGRIDAGSLLGTESEPSDLSDDETHYRDDKTARTMRTVKTLRVPEGEVTIIYTDVQGSTSLWEADPLAMKKATDLHDSIIRRCYAEHGGYEITTEGDAFNLAFQHPADAISWALRAQLLLYRAKWPEGILNHPDGCDNEKKKFRGFRVRMGMHHGATTSHVHETTGRTIYQGEAVNIAKAIEKMSHGGQILTTVETWRAVSGMAEQLLGSPQVMDCGEHLLFDPKKKENPNNSKKKTSKRIFSKRIVQLVPNSLSYDFFAARGGQEVQEGETPPRVCGRVFPPLLSHGQLSTSFLNAPYIGNRVAMVFVYTDKMEAVSDKERKKNYKILAKYVRSHLMRLSPPGYECQEDKGSWMLAFDRIENGIKFGLDLKEDVMNSAELFGDVDKERAFRIGIHWGPFLSMGPHTVSGHADYFGPIVNRAARVAAQCEPGQVCVGVPMGDDEEPPDPGPSVDVDVLGVKQLKGISIEMAIFACRKRTTQPKS